MCAKKRDSKNSFNWIKEALSKGQLLSIALVFPLTVAVWRMPNKDLLSFSEGIFEILAKSCSWAWGLFILTLLVSIIVFKRMRKVQHEEIKRISEEKSILHELLLGRKPTSSNN